jgi:hypothetical protein
MKVSTQLHTQATSLLQKQPCPTPFTPSTQWKAHCVAIVGIKPTEKEQHGSTKHSSHITLTYGIIYTILFLNIPQRKIPTPRNRLPFIY